MNVGENCQTRVYGGFDNDGDDTNDDDKNDNDDDDDNDGDDTDDSDNDDDDNDNDDDNDGDDDDNDDNDDDDSGSLSFRGRLGSTWSKWIFRGQLKLCCFALGRMQKFATLIVFALNRLTDLKRFLGTATYL